MYFFSTQWGATVDYSLESSNKAKQTVIQKCGCGKEIVFFSGSWYETELDFDMKIVVPARLHSGCGKYPTFKPSIDSSYFDIAENDDQFNRMRRFIFFSHGKGASNNISAWPNITIEGIPNFKVDTLPQEFFVSLFEKYYKWWTGEHAGFELDACEIYGCVNKGFHGGPGVLKCPLRNSWCSKSMTHCDCYTIKVEGNCVESLIGEVSKEKEPMKNVSFLSFVTGMLNFLKERI